MKLSNDFVALDATAGVFYSPVYDVEIATGESTPDKDSGFVLEAGRPIYFSSESTIYARATGTHATLNVVAGTMS